MHPNFKSDKQTPCAICKMDLVRVDPESKRDNVDSAQGTVQIPEERARLIGIKLSMAQERDLKTMIHASARVVNDPYLASMMVEFQSVSNYSSTEPQPGESPNPYQQEFRSRANSATIRLQQVGIDPKSIAKRIDPSLNLNKPDGFAWVHADVFDYEAPLVKSGQDVQLTSPAYPGRIFRGQILAMDSGLNKDTRMQRVRIGVPNLNGELRSEMVLTAIINANIGRRLAVPSSAVFDTGTRQLVYVNRSEGVYEPRSVRLGREADDYVEIIEGLKSGERVVSSANFFIDSESKLQATISQP